MKKMFICVLALAVAAAVLCGCQARRLPETAGQESESGGMTGAQPGREEAVQPDPSAAEILQHCEDFKSSDGSVEVHFAFDQEIPMAALPVTEVKPRFLTGEDAKRVAEILLPGAEFYEQENSASPKFSKQELEAAMNRLRPYADLEKLRGLLGDHPEDMMEYVQPQLDYFQEQFEAAPEENPHTPCDWRLKKQRHYYNHPMETSGRKPEEDDDILAANAHVNGLDYQLYLSQCNFPDRKLNSLSLSIHGGIGFLDQEIFRAGLCRTAEPTQAQTTALEEKTQSLLDRMDVGDFKVLPARVDSKEYNGVREYIVWVDAVPVLGGIPAMRDQHSKMGDYFLTSAQFGFSPTGELLYFDLAAPVQVLSVEKAAAPLPIQALVEKAKTYLTTQNEYSDLGCDKALVEMWEELRQEKSRSIVIVNQVQYGLGRVNAPGTDETFRYVPVVGFYGTVDYLGVDSGEHFCGTADYSNEIQPLLWLNAMDGTVIQ